LKPVILLLLTTWVLAAADQPRRPAVAWVWSGAVTAHSAVVKASVSVPRALVRLELVAAGGDDHGQPPRDVAADADGVAAFGLQDLKPATRYDYRVAVEASPPLEGSLRTFPDGPSDFRIAFASCADTGSRSAVFDAIREARPDLFIHMGDLHYEDISRNDPGLFRRAYDAVLSSPTQSRLYAHVPIAYMWDDHDFGPNDATAASPSRPAALAVYQQFVPHYPLQANGEPGIEQAFTIGRARVILTDARSRREPATGGRPGTVLGPKQLRWLKDQLAEATSAALVIWVNPVPWIAGRGAGSDTWAGYAAEREEIATHIDRLGLTGRLVMLSGDAHMVAIDDGRHSNYAAGRKPGEPGFVVAHAAPLDRSNSVKGGPYSHGVSTLRNQFGLLEVKDDGSTLSIEVTGRDGRGRTLPGMRLLLACTDAGCRPTRR
jgi:phosphodiesterase/alkaline phosphatase D-like protein